MCKVVCVRTHVHMQCPDYVVVLLQVWKHIHRYLLSLCFASTPMCVTG